MSDCYRLLEPTREAPPQLASASTVLFAPSTFRASHHKRHCEAPTTSWFALINHHGRHEECVPVNVRSNDLYNVDRRFPLAPSLAMAIAVLCSQLCGCKDQEASGPSDSATIPNVTAIPNATASDVPSNPQPAQATSPDAATAQQQTIPFWPETTVEQSAGATPINYLYPPGDIRRYISSFSGTTDQTTAVQNWLKLGGYLTAPLAGTVAVSSSLTLTSGTTLIASSGFVIKQANSGNISGPILSGSSLSNVTIDGLTIDGNAANNSTAWTFGVKLSNGDDNIIRNFYVHDTTQACIEIADESSDRIDGNWLINCGREEGTDNHGIMVIAVTSTPSQNIVINHNFVNTAYRKGIAVYSDTPGTEQGITIEGNITINCGLGGIYVATAPGTTALKDVVVADNISIDNYMNIEMSNVEGGEIVGNEAEAGTAQSIYLSDDVGVSVTGNTVVDAGTDGIFATSINSTSKGLTIAGNMVLYANQNSSASGAGIHLTGITNSTVSGDTILGESTSPHQAWGILEDGSSNRNMITRDQITNATSGLVHTVGADSAWDSQDGLTFTTNASISPAALIASGTAATISACGAPTVTGGGFAGSFAAGDTSCDPMIVTGTTAPHGWHCRADDETTDITFRETAYTTTSATLTASGSATTGDVIDFSCIAF